MSRLRLETIDGEADCIATLKALHDGQTCFCERSGEVFRHSLHSWKQQSTVARDAEDHIVGYAIHSRDQKTVVELVAKDAEFVIQFVGALSDRIRDDDLSIVIDGLPMPLQREIANFAEDLSIHPCGNWQVYDWPAVITSLTSLRHAQCPLATGSVVIGTDDHRTAFRLTVDCEGPRCDLTNDPPDVYADAPTLTRLLFGPLAPGRVMPVPPSASILEAWCPLPLSIPAQDHV